MGLDISAFKRAKFVRALKPGEESDCEWPRMTYLHVNSDFPQRADGMENGLYDVGGDTRFGEEKDRGGAHQLHFRAGSYIGYSWWREALAKIALDATPKQIWDDPSAYGGKPFVDLINFSDCEGIIGPNTCARLDADFKVHGASVRLRAPKILGEDAEWFLKQFDLWSKAFDLAADTGAVKFH